MREVSNFPSDNEFALVEIFYIKGDDLFICGFYGQITSTMLDDIEKYLSEDWDDSCFPHGEGHYAYEIHWDKEETDHEGRVTIPGYWDFTFDSYKPIPVEEV